MRVRGRWPEKRIHVVYLPVFCFLEFFHQGNWRKIDLIKPVLHSTYSEMSLIFTNLFTVLPLMILTPHSSAAT